MNPLPTCQLVKLSNFLQLGDPTFTYFSMDLTLYRHLRTTKYQLELCVGVICWRLMILHFCNYLLKSDLLGQIPTKFIPLYLCSHSAWEILSDLLQVTRSSQFLYFSSYNSGSELVWSWFLCLTFKLLMKKQVNPVMLL